jgi:outer membrane immunogenic protein
MKKSLLAIALLAATSLTANAVEAAPFSWAGWYAGVSAGEGFGTNSWNNLTVPSDTDQNVIGTIVDNNNYSSFMAGIQGGYNWQVKPNVVLGVEAKFSSGMKTDNQNCIGNPDYGDYTATCKSKINWIGSISGRAGIIPLDNLLVYVKAGYAYNHATMQPADEHPLYSGYSPTAGYGETKVHRSGLLLGVGAEFPITSRWTLGAEYDYIDFGHYSATATPNAPLDSYNPPFTTTITDKIRTLNVNVNYKF